MKQRWIQTKDGLVRVDSNRPKEVDAPYVFGDIEEHRNMATGEMVSTRSRHRQILREHNLEEFGNEDLAKHTPDKRIDTNVKDAIFQAMEQLK